MISRQPRRQRRHRPRRNHRWHGRHRHTVRPPMISRFFIDRPIFAAVLSIVITLAGGIAVFSLPIVAVSRHHAADGASFGQLSRRQCAGGGRHRGRADRAASQRRRGDAVHVEPVGQRRLVQPDGDVRPGDESEHGPGDGAKPGVAGHAAVARLGAAARADDQEEIAQHPAVGQLLFARRSLRQHLSEQFRHDPRQGRIVSSGGRGGHQLPGRARL